MINEAMYKLGSNRSAIRDLFEFGQQRKKECGEENVFDFSIGNPSVAVPESLQKELIKIVTKMDPLLLHGYTSAQGDIEARKSIAMNLNQNYHTNFTADNLYLTVGAAAALSICFKTVITEKYDEIITFAPFFPEYKVFVESSGGKLIVVPPKYPDFQLDIESLNDLITEKTTAILINTPNNPSGVIYSEKSLKLLSDFLNKKQKEYGHDIYIISDEPYREINYGKSVPFVTHFYDNTVICYSYSKSLSLPGERIGYVLVPNSVTDSKKFYAAVCGSGRSLGYVCAPSLFQHLITKCSNMSSDFKVYKENRDILYKGLTNLGYECVYPDGAFYLFMKALESDSVSFCEKAKKYNLLLVPADSFGCQGFVRIAYCVSKSTIERSMKAFEKLANEYK